jgi:hypothetical protein
LGFREQPGTIDDSSDPGRPLTEIALIIEFTDADDNFLISISFAVAGSISAYYLCSWRNV